MNTTYISQCAAAKELQEKLYENLRMGEVVRYYNPPLQGCQYRILNTDINKQWVEKNLALAKAKQQPCFIIPTQEQLWAMLPKRQDSRYFGVVLESGYYTGYLTIAHLSEWEDGYGGYKTLEETLLCMVMYFVHNKTWDFKKGVWK